jgi:uncharacterized protein (DUF697 family)
MARDGRAGHTSGMDTRKKQALRWVHRYALGGAALAAIPIPVSHTASLAALETYLLKVIGEVYGQSPSGTAVAAAGGTFAVGGQALKQLAMTASCYVPVLGIPIRMAIAGATIEALGRAIIAHYESKRAEAVGPATALHLN